MRADDTGSELGMDSDEREAYGITADTRIVIRSTQQGQNGYFRWFLDDIKMTKIAAE